MKTFLTCLLILVTFFSFGQIEDLSKPIIFSKNIEKDKILQIYIDTLTKKSIQIPTDKQKRQFVGIEVAVNIKPIFSFSDNHENIFLVQINVPKAKSLGINIEYSHTENAKFYIISKDFKIYTGGINSYDNDFSNLYTQLLPTDTIFVEIHLKKNVKPEEFKIKSVIIGLVNFGSQWCEKDINCFSDSIWQTLKKAVVRYTFKDYFTGNYYLCSGQLIANTNLDNTPYLLTAQHCITTTEEANTAVFYFNYEKINCNGQQTYPQQTLSGAYLISSGGFNLDFSLLKLKQIPPPTYEPYYAGWKRTTEYKGTSTCIHHPNGDYKKLSQTTIPLQTSTFNENDTNTHWLVPQWQIGSTEGGSSGSALLNESGQIIGILSGGDASCDANYNDYFQNFFFCWDKFPKKTKQLRHWLDSLGAEIEELDGYFIYDTLNLPIPQCTYSLKKQYLTIKWNALDPKPDFYVIYKNYKIFATSTDTFYNETIMQPGVYTYYIKASYNQKKSKNSNIIHFVYGDTSKVPKFSYLNIFPQPASNFVYVNLPDSIEITKIEIYNPLGQLIMNIPTYNRKLITLDISKLSVGVYFLIIRDEKKIIRRPFLKWIN